MQINQAVKILEQHDQIILGTTETGVCVLDQSSKLLQCGKVVAWDQTVWIPATKQALIEFLNY